MRALLPILLLAAVAAADLPVPDEWLVIGPTDHRGRQPFNPDAVFARYLLDPSAPPPREGETVTGDAGSATWERAAGRDLAGDIAYAYATLESAFDRIVLMRLRGGGTLFVNGDPFVGDIYGYDHGGVPIALREGTNHLFVRGVRGTFRLELSAVRNAELHVHADLTQPDLVLHEQLGGWAGLVRVNATLGRRPGCPPLGVRRPAMFFPAVLASSSDGIMVVFEQGEDPPQVDLAVRKPGEARRRTFVSSIDGSVQQYALLPPTGDPKAAGIVLSLHGAGVDAYNQARAYSPKEDFWIVAPTNRRPFGCDWQDWGRADAYEALADALRVTGAPADRVYLTGHSMGGHGVWHLAANDPDRFVAIAPSAGWSTFDSYVGRPMGDLTTLWHGADGASQTLELLPNLVALPTFILHGADDDNVPALQGRLMADALRAAGGDPAVHFQEGAKHWWDGDASPGVDCVDWPGIFELFRRSAPRDPAEIDFVSVDPGVDARHHWIAVEQPLVYGRRLRVRARRLGDRVEIETENVRRLGAPMRAGRIVVDGTEFAGGGWLLRTDEGWTAAAPVPSEKSSARCGPFKRVFDHRFVFVYGDETSMKRARYDAQQWWYRANGDVLVLADEEFLAGGYEERNVVLYGNATTNRAWDAVLPEDCPIRVEAGGLALGDRRFKGVALGCLFVYPRKGETGTLVGVFGHTGRPGARIGYGLLPFTSGVGYPDYAVFSETYLGGGDAGVLAAGWFDHAWKLSATSGR